MPLELHEITKSNVETDDIVNFLRQNKKAYTIVELQKEFNVTEHVLHDRLSVKNRTIHNIQITKKGHKTYYYIKV